MYSCANATCHIFLLKSNHRDKKKPCLWHGDRSCITYEDTGVNTVLFVARGKSSENAA